MKYPKRNKRPRRESLARGHKPSKIPKRIRTNWKKFGEIDWNRIRRGVLVDSCIIIDAVQEKRSANDLLGLLEKPSIASISRVESMGLKNERLFKRTEDIVLSLTMIDLTEEIQLKASALLRNRRPKKTADAIIAATAIIENLPLLTFNVKDFDLPEVEVLNFETLVERTRPVDREELKRQAR